MESIHQKVRKCCWDSPPTGRPPPAPLGRQVLPPPRGGSETNSERSELILGGGSVLGMLTSFMYNIRLFIYIYKNIRKVERTGFFFWTFSWARLKNPFSTTLAHFSKVEKLLATSSCACTSGSTLMSKRYGIIIAKVGRATIVWWSKGLFVVWSWKCCDIHEQMSWQMWQMYTNVEVWSFGCPERESLFLFCLQRKNSAKADVCVNLWDISHVPFHQEIQLAECNTFTLWSEINKLDAASFLPTLPKKISRKTTTNGPTTTKAPPLPLPHQETTIRESALRATLLCTTSSPRIRRGQTATITSTNCRINTWWEKLPW